MVKGFKHSEETKQLISKAAKGKGKGGFNVKINCPSCQLIMSPANLAKHLGRCEKTRGLFLMGKELSVKEQKILRMILKPTGWTLENYIYQHNKQNDRCYICGELTKKRLYADHCHKENKPRKLLCVLCNTGLGAFRDDKQILLKAVSYLTEFDPYKD